MLTEPAPAENQWRALVRPGRKVAIGERLVFPARTAKSALEAEVLERGEFGERLLRFAPVEDFFAALDRIGHMPLPPYIHRDDADADRERYQTVFAHERGSVAAPTAGLHFTPRVARRSWRARRGGCTRDAARGAGHLCAAARRARGRGPAAPRALHDRRRRRREALNRRRSRRPPHCRRGHHGGAHAGGCGACGRRGRIEPHSGETEIFISPGFEFRLVGALLTNFHLPQSSLLMLVSAFAGRERVLAAYRHAVSGGTASSATATVCF